MTYGDDFGQPQYPQQGYGQFPPQSQPPQYPQVPPWQPQQYIPGAHQRRMQGPPPEAPWQQAPFPNQGPQLLPQGQSWQQPGYGQQPYMPPQSPRRKSWTARHKVLTGFLAFCGLAFVIGIAAAIGSPSSPAAAPSTPAAPAQTQTAAAANPAVAHKPSFPPKTLADFRAFAATGDPSQVQQIATSTEGLPSCPEPNIYVTVSPGLTGKALEADLAAFFVQSGLLGNQCQAFVFAYHSESDYQANQGDGFTAGRVALTSNSGSGPQHNLEIDAGEETSEANNMQAKFNFDF
jgi:hypothetical protein